MHAGQDRCMTGKKGQELCRTEGPRTPMDIRNGNLVNVKIELIDNKNPRNFRAFNMFCIKGQ